MTNRSKRRLAENEVVFRKYNESISRGFDNLKRIAKEEDQEHSLAINDEPLLFYCECSDENCLRRISIKPSVYAAIHKNRSRFAIVACHETTSIEHVLEKYSDYWIVEKNETPDKNATELKDTSINNIDDNK